MAKDTRRGFFKLADKLEPNARAAFNKSIKNMINGVPFNDLVRALERGQVELAASFLQINEDYFDSVAAAMREAYIAGGGIAIGTIPKGQKTPQGTTANIVFGGTRPNESAQVIEEFNGFITEIKPDTEFAVRKIIGDAVLDGQHPHTTALDLVGRVNASGTRTGGVIGLHSRDMETIQSVRRAFRDPANHRGRINSYFNLQGRDQRLDKRIKRILASGGTFTEEYIADITRHMKNNYLRARARTIARTEILGALGKGREAGYQRIIDEGLAVRESVFKVWDAIGDGLTRPTHQAIDGVKVLFDQPFNLPSGQLMHPRDRSLGAGAEDIINCRCYARVEIRYLDNRNLI